LLLNQSQRGKQSYRENENKILKDQVEEFMNSTSHKLNFLEVGNIRKRM